MRRIGLVYDSRDWFSESFLRGVGDHRRAGAEWRMRLLDLPLMSRRGLADLRAWGPDGLVCLDQHSADLVDGLGVPVVRMRPGPGAAVVFDEERIGAAAADHLLERGLRRLAVVSWDTIGWRGQRVAGFAATCARGGVAAERLIASTDELGAGTATWARAAPGPSGIFAINDWLGTSIIDSCVDAGVDVPGRLAVIGADDAEAWCDLSSVPLSSVRVPHRAAARAAAAQLDRVLAGGAAPRTPLRLPPLGVTRRRSTMLDAIEDPALRRALECISERAVHGAGVARVVAASGIGRRALEKRFRARLGRTILRTIHRYRIDHAVSLLTDSRLSIPQIATRCGFGNATRFNEACHRHAGTTPGALRRLNQG